MAGTQRLLAIAMAFSLMDPSSGGKADVLGIVVRANQASVGSETTAEGTTVYDGDHLSTNEGGALELQAGEATLSLTERSRAVVHAEAKGTAKQLEVELVAGVGVLAVEMGTSGEIVADSALIRPMAGTRAVVQVRVVGPRELIVFARRGAAEISYRDETETIAEGKCYRVLLNSGQDGAAAEPPPRQPGKNRKLLLLIAIGAGVAGIILPTVLRGSGRGAESPDRP